MYVNYRRLSRVVRADGQSDDPEIRQEVIDFLSENPDPEDEVLHDWAEGKGYDVHEVEDQVYKLATAYVKFLTAGRALEQDLSEDEVDADELKMGIEVEMEHTTDKETAKRIALDHLAEVDDYYTRLKEIERA